MMQSIFLLLFMVLGLISVRLGIIQENYELNKAMEQIRTAQRELRERELEVHQLGSLERLAQISNSKFRLAPPRSEQVIHLGALEDKERD